MHQRQAQARAFGFGGVERLEDPLDHRGGHARTVVLEQDLDLADVVGDRFQLLVFFGRDPEGRRHRLAQALFRQFPAPLMRATFHRNAAWELQSIAAIPASAIPDEHRAAAQQAVQAFFAGRGPRPATRIPSRFELALLVEQGEAFPPSDDRAIQRFIDAAEEVGIAAEVIDKGDMGRLLEFDALFIRATTAVNHYTYRFARRTAAMWSS